jgi:hypothetical protein
MTAQTNEGMNGVTKGLHFCRDSSTDTVLWLAHRQDVNMLGMLAAFTRPVKNQNAWRPVYGRLQLINSLVPLFGVNKGSEGGFQLEPVMKFVGSAFTSANAEVRSQAVKVTLLLYSKVITIFTITIIIVIVLILTIRTMISVRVIISILFTLSGSS